MKINRLHKIKALLEEVGSISIDQLCETFQVSKNTIRRDIAELEKYGDIKKVYGGITLNHSAPPEPFSTREIKNQGRKKLIAKLATNLISDGDVIYIDSGTTTMHLIPYLAEKKNLTIITASVHVINAAAAYPDMNVIATGGSFYRPSNAFIGASVINCLKDFNLSKTFLAATGFSIENGATNATPAECEIKKYVSEKSQTRILLVDASKIEKVSLMTFSQLKDFEYIVTDRMPPQEYLDYFAEHSVTLISDDNAQ